MSLEWERFRKNGCYLQEPTKQVFTGNFPEGHFINPTKSDHEYTYVAYSFRKYVMYYFFLLLCQFYHSVTISLSISSLIVLLWLCLCSCFTLPYLYHHIGLAVRVFANGPGDLGSIPGQVIPKTQKIVLDTSLLNTQHYKVQIKGKAEQSRERSSALPYTLV